MTKNELEGAGAKADRNAKDASPDRPFPLLKRFLVAVLPMMIVGFAGLELTMRQSLIASIESFQAYGDAEVARSLVSSYIRFDSGGGVEVSPEIATEMRERDILCFAVLDARGRPFLVAPAGSPGCKAPAPAAFDETKEDQAPMLVEDLVQPGSWSSLAALPAGPSHPALLTALSRSGNLAEASIRLLAWRQILIFAGLLALAALLALWLVLRAQRVLDAAHFAEIDRRRRTERLLSKSARQSVLSAEPTARRYEAVALFADLRNFSSFAETAGVEASAALIDRFVDAVTQAVEEEDGDVDKLLGDGMLAWFTGPMARERALRAAIGCIRNSASLERRPGVGLFEGPVLAVSLGQGDRIDFTILGRAVNLASRLSALAPESEICLPDGVFDREAERLGLAALSRETLGVRNHKDPVTVVRMRIPDTPSAER